jgi:hypothetical protein
MFEDTRNTIEQQSPAEGLDADLPEPTLFSEGAIIFLIVVLTVVLEGFFGVKAWVTRKKIKYRPGSTHNLQRRRRFILYVVALIAVLFISEIWIFSITLR